MSPERHITWLLAEADKYSRPTAVAKFILDRCYSAPPEQVFAARMAKTLPSLLPLPGGNNPERVTYRPINEISIGELMTAIEFLRRLMALKAKHALANGS